MQGNISIITFAYPHVVFFAVYPVLWISNRPEFCLQQSSVRLRWRRRCGLGNAAQSTLQLIGGISVILAAACSKRQQQHRRKQNTQQLLHVCTLLYVFCPTCIRWCDRANSAYKKPQPPIAPPQYSQQPFALGIVVAPHQGQVVAVLGAAAAAASSRTCVRICVRAARISSAIASHST